jgi:hypothetical protein
VAPVETDQLAFKVVQVKLDAANATGASGDEVLMFIVFEFKLVLHPLLARTR